MYWVAIGVLATIVGTVCLAVVRGRLGVLAFPFVLSLVMAYLYILLPIRAILPGNLWLYITPEQATWAILFPTMALSAFCLGWFAIARCRSSRSQTSHVWGVATGLSPRVLYRSGLVLAVIGIGLWGCFLVFSGGVLTYYSRVHGSGGRYEDTTAWLYSGIHLVYPGLALMTIALVRARTRSKSVWVPFIILLLGMYSHAVLIAGRGPFFQLTATVATAYMLANRSRPSTLVTVCGLSICVIVPFFLVGYRKAIFIGTSIQEFREVGFADITAPPEGSTGSGEFIYHAGILTTVDHLHRYGWGQLYLNYLVLHPIPRLWWPSKHRVIWDTGGVTDIDVTQMMGWLVSYGSAEGLVANFYREWGVFSLVAWCLLGGMLASLYKGAIKDHASPTSMLCYAVVFGRSLHLFAQAFPTFMQSVLIMLAGAYSVIWLCSHWSGVGIEDRVHWLPRRDTYGCYRRASPRRCYR